MREIPKNLCVFIHYSQYACIPYYVKIYAEELSKSFDEVILVTNKRHFDKDITYKTANISTLLVKNEGYDLGMFYKAIQTIELQKYDQIACVNDSNILINPLTDIFDWSKKHQADFWGIIDSYQKPSFSTHSDNYHIQSHFIVFNQNAISKMPDFFNSLNIQEILTEKDAKKVRQLVIDKWEIGLSQFLINNGLSCTSYIDSKSLCRKYLSGKNANVSLKLYPELIRAGLPLLKVKVITKGKWKDIFRTESYWKNLIRKYGNKQWDIELITKELNQIKRDFGNQPLNKIRRKLFRGN